MPLAEETHQEEEEEERAKGAVEGRLHRVLPCTLLQPAGGAVQQVVALQQELPAMLLVVAQHPHRPFVGLQVGAAAGAAEVVLVAAGHLVHPQARHARRKSCTTST